MYIRYNLYLTVKVIKDTFFLEKGDTESGLGLKKINKSNISTYHLVKYCPLVVQGLFKIRSG